MKSRQFTREGSQGKATQLKGIYACSFARKSKYSYDKRKPILGSLLESIQQEIQFLKYITKQTKNDRFHYKGNSSETRLSLLFIISRTQVNCSCYKRIRRVLLALMTTATKRGVLLFTTVFRLGSCCCTRVQHTESSMFESCVKFASVRVHALFHLPKWFVGRDNKIWSIVLEDNLSRTTQPLPFILLIQPTEHSLTLTCCHNYKKELYQNTKLVKYTRIKTYIHTTTDIHYILLKYIQM